VDVDLASHARGELSELAVSNLPQGTEQGLESGGGVFLG
jgi:hypothetical protein